jgi:hypothetical protein
MRNYRALTDSHNWTPAQADERKQVSYPLNNRYYTAKYPQAWLATRTQGVYCNETDLLLTPAGGLMLTLSPGMAWIRIERFQGTCFANLEDIEVHLSVPHSIHPRIDRIVLRYDVVLGDIFPAIYDGIPATNPVPVDIERNENGYELGVWDVLVEAGALEITAAHLTDLRPDEVLCGLMRDGVTGIPTQHLQDAWLAWFSTYRLTTEADFTAWFNTVKDTLAEDVAGNLLIMIQDVSAVAEEAARKAEASYAATIPVSAWIRNDVNFWNATVTRDGLLETDTITVFPADWTAEEIIYRNLFPFIDTKENSFMLTADVRPRETLNIRYTINNLKEDT